MTKCLNCKIETRNQKFCSTSCSASFNNIGKARNIKRGKYAKKKCLTCGKDTNNPKYCSLYCANIIKRHYNKNIEDIVTDKGRRRWLIFHRGHKCSKCMRVTWNGKDIPLELEHIDGNPENNNVENLDLLCPNCHAQTDTYKGKNVGKVKNSLRQQTMKKYTGKYRK